MHPQMEKRPAEYLDLENDLDSLLPSDGKVRNEFGHVTREPQRGASCLNTGYKNNNSNNINWVVYWCSQSSSMNLKMGHP